MPSTCVRPTKDDRACRALHSCLPGISLGCVLGMLSMSPSCRCGIKNMWPCRDRNNPWRDFITPYERVSHCNDCQLVERPPGCKEQTHYPLFGNYGLRPSLTSHSQNNQDPKFATVLLGPYNEGEAAHKENQSVYTRG